MQLTSRIPAHTCSFWHSPEMAGTLIICATPIGNLGDVSPRLADVLRDADVVYAEDTRRAAILLRHLGVDVPTRSYFVGNEEARAAELGERLRSGERVVLISDAGTPSIADPGVSAVRAARAAGAPITAVPGPSAVTTALAVSGFGADRFAFEGFLPRKGKDRARRLESLAADDRTLVFFAATARVAEDLADLAAALGEDREAAVCRELTKLHEEIVHATLGEAAAYWQATEPRGEFTIVVAPRPVPGPSLEDAVALVAARVEAGESMSAAVRAVSDDLGIPRRRLYEATLRRR